ncbi:hypothetical protein AB9F29_08075 [Falsihalocynthiibacter sp. S25ZX9]|uniref:hypothetical protein n=1 Tax=Falsihalocynthiibacter sp. S25ZX9 TaxID=3240870 RepID=UPI00350F9FAC
MFHILWSSSGQPIEDTAKNLRAKAQFYLSRLSANTREALLLSTVADFDTKDIGAIMAVSEQDATSLILLAHDEMHQSVFGK